jgi:hypothetical protein
MVNSTGLYIGYRDPGSSKLFSGQQAPRPIELNHLGEPRDWCVLLCFRSFLSALVALALCLSLRLTLSLSILRVFLVPFSVSPLTNRHCFRYITDVVESLPVMFTGAANGDPRLAIRVGNSQWSHPFDLRSLAPTGNVEIIDTPHKYVYLLTFFASLHAHTHTLSLSLSLSLSLVLRITDATLLRKGDPARAFQFHLTLDPMPSKFWRTKQVSIRPMFHLINKLQEVVQYCQDGCNLHYSLMPGEATPFHWFDHTKPRALRISMLDSAWSGAFHIGSIGTSHVKMRSCDPKSLEVAHVKVQCNLDADSIMVLLMEENLALPEYRLLNHCSIPLLIGQADHPNLELLPPSTAYSFAWDEPTNERKRLRISFRGANLDDAVLISIDKFKVQGAECKHMS